MIKSPQSADFQLLRLMRKLSKDSEFLNNKDFISVVHALKLISTNSQFVENLIKSFKVLEQTEIHTKGNLTQREKQVLLLIGEGHKNCDIAVRLNLSIATIKTHRKNMGKN